MKKPRYNFSILVVCCLFLLNSIPLSASGNSVNSFVRNADAYFKQGNYFLAVNFYDRSIKISPNDIELYYKRAFALGKSKQYGKAIKDFSLVIKKAKKDFPHAYRFRADCFMALGYMQRASKDYLAFLRILPKDGKVWSHLAEAYALMGRADLALKAIRRGLATGSHWEKRLKNLQIKILSGAKIKPHAPFSN